jgi:dihydrolipoamide dehydrogenase
MSTWQPPRAGQPQIAGFGWTESEARDEGFHVNLVSDARYGELLGAHLIGPDVTRPPTR